MAKAIRCLAPIAAAPQFYDKWCKIYAHPEEWTEYMRYRDGTTSHNRYRLFQNRPQVWIDRGAGQKTP